MLKPGGQLVFFTFEKMPADSAFDALDQGKWSHYNNGIAISPFYRCDDVIVEYQNVIKSVGFGDYHIFKQPFKLKPTERVFEGEMEK